VNRRWRVAIAACTLAAAQAHGGEFVPPGGSFRVHVESLKERRFRTVLKQLYDYSCGAAAAATLLSRHYARSTSEEEAVAAMLAHGDPARIVREGFSMLDLKQLLVSRGLQADGYRLTLDQLVGHGVPAIALLSEQGYKHFVVVQGMRGGRVLLGDPATGLRAISRARFEAASTGVFLVARNDAATARATFNDARAWSAAPPAPLENALTRDAVAPRLLALPGPHDF